MITGYVVGSEDFIARLEKMPGVLRDALRRAVEYSAIDLQTKVKEDKLSGQVLHVRTDVLRSSITYRMEDTTTGVYGIVGTKVNYGGYWEYGFDKKIGAGSRGWPHSLKGKAFDAYVAKHPPGVRHIEARSFLRTTLAEQLPTIRARINGAILAATNRGLHE